MGRQCPSPSQPFFGNPGSGGGTLADPAAIERLSAGGGLVKICSLREPAQATATVAAGADLFGLIFAPARRRVTVEQATAIAAAARAAAGNRPVLAVGVFVDAAAAEINRITETVGLDLVQLHGAEPPTLLSALSRPAIKAFRPPAGTSAATLADLIAPYQSAAVPPLAVLIDGFSAAAPGGEGVRSDWHLAATVASRWPVVLAGGLDPANVAAAVAAVRPRIVDVSSGVETAGVKDAVKIAAFIANAKRAFAIGDTAE